MSYKLPSPSVTQILVRATQNLADADLLSCLVGPLYRVVNKKQILSTIVGVTLPVTVAYPQLDPGAIVDLSSVKLTLKNAHALVANGVTFLTSTSYFVAGTKSVTIPGLTTTGIKASDILKVASNGGTYIIDSVSGETINLTSTIYHTITSSDTGQGTFQVLRKYDSYTTVKDMVIDSFGVSVTAFEDDNNYTFQDGVASLSYRALRKDMTGFYEVTNQDTLANDMEIVPSNPLGFYLNAIINKANGGKTALAYVTNDETYSSFSFAFENLATSRKPYAISCLSDSAEVMQLLSTHAFAMSEPDESNFRIALINTPIVTEKSLATFSHSYV